MSIPSTTANRVKDHTAPKINRRIREKTEREIEKAMTGGQLAIQARLTALDREWDVERAIETGASTLVSVGAVLALAVDARWAFLSLGVGLFLFQHAIQGWCPPLPVFRRLGFRTADEINEERYRLRS